MGQSFKMRVAYYNEIDPYAAAWLRSLIAAGHIAPGHVDERDIRDIAPSDLSGYTQCHFFAGIGVWSAALRDAGWSDDRPVWTGSCPCQPFSAAGRAGGFADERHLWPAFFHLIGECRPPIVFGEQVASKDGLGWFDLVHADLEGTGYAVGAADLCAAGVGAPHIRQRLWFVGDASGSRLEGRSLPERRCRDKWSVRPSGGEATERMGDSDGGGWEQIGCTPTDDAPTDRGRQTSWDRGPSTSSPWSDADWLPCRDGKWRPAEPGTFPLAHGAPARVGRLRAYGNAIVKKAASTFISAYLNTETQYGRPSHR